MRIKYLRIHSDDGHSHLDDGTEFVFENNNVNFFDYEYIREVKVFPKISKQAIDYFIRVVNLTKKSSTKEECKSFCQKIIKLIYLRKNLSLTKKFNVPLFFDPSGESLTGDGRILISTFYVPDIKFDCVFLKEGYTQGVQYIEKLITDIAKHKGYSLKEKTILIAMQCKNISSDVRVEYIRNLEFVDHDVYDQKLFDPTTGHYLSWNHLDYNLWNDVYDIIKQRNLSSINDYIDLLHTITSIEI
jgi:hypothetical protein